MYKQPLIIISFLFFYQAQAQTNFNVNKQLQYCVRQSGKTLQQLPDKQPNIPRSIAHDSTAWQLVGYRDWTCGFFPGVLWMNYKITKDVKWKKAK